VKFQVKVETTVTGWVDVEISDSLWEGETEDEMREWAADEAVDFHVGELREWLTGFGLNVGEITVPAGDLSDVVRVIE
jgi:hypothetical protein